MDTLHLVQQSIKQLLEWTRDDVKRDILFTLPVELTIDEFHNIFSLPVSLSIVPESLHPSYRAPVVTISYIIEQILAHGVHPLYPSILADCARILNNFTFIPDNGVILGSSTTSSMGMVSVLNTLVALLEVVFLGTSHLAPVLCPFVKFPQHSSPLIDSSDSFVEWNKLATITHGAFTALAVLEPSHVHDGTEHPPSSSTPAPIVSLKQEVVSSYSYDAFPLSHRALLSSLAMTSIFLRAYVSETPVDSDQSYYQTVLDQIGFMINHAQSITLDTTVDVLFSRVHQQQLKNGTVVVLRYLTPYITHPFITPTPIVSAVAQVIGIPSSPSGQAVPETVLDLLTTYSELLPSYECSAPANAKRLLSYIHSVFPYLLNWTSSHTFDQVQSYFTRAFPSSTDPTDATQAATPGPTQHGANKATTVGILESTLVTFINTVSKSASYYTKCCFSPTVNNSAVLEDAFTTLMQDCSRYLSSAPHQSITNSLWDEHEPQQPTSPDHNEEGGDDNDDGDHELFESSSCLLAIREVVLSFLRVIMIVKFNPSQIPATNTTQPSGSSGCSPLSCFLNTMVAHVIPSYEAILASIDSLSLHLFQQEVLLVESLGELSPTPAPSPVLHPEATTTTLYALNIICQRYLDTISDIITSLAPITLTGDTFNAIIGHETAHRSFTTTILPCLYSIVQLYSHYPEQYHPCSASDIDQPVLTLGQLDALRTKLRTTSLQLYEPTTRNPYHTSPISFPTVPCEYGVFQHSAEHGTLTSFFVAFLSLLPIQHSVIATGNNGLSPVSTPHEHLLSPLHFALIPRPQSRSILASSSPQEEPTRLMKIFSSLGYRSFTIIGYILGHQATQHQRTLSQPRPSGRQAAVNPSGLLSTGNMLDLLLCLHFFVKNYLSPSLTASSLPKMHHDEKYDECKLILSQHTLSHYFASCDALTDGSLASWRHLAPHYIHYFQQVVPPPLLEAVEGVLVSLVNVILILQHEDGLGGHDQQINPLHLVYLSPIRSFLFRLLTLGWDGENKRDDPSAVEQLILAGDGGQSSQQQVSPQKMIFQFYQTLSSFITTELSIAIKTSTGNTKSSGHVISSSPCPLTDCMARLLYTPVAITPNKKNTKQSSQYNAFKCVRHELPFLGDVYYALPSYVLQHKLPTLQILAIRALRISAQALVRQRPKHQSSIPIGVHTFELGDLTTSIFALTTLCPIQTLKYESSRLFTAIIGLLHAFNSKVSTSPRQWTLGNSSAPLSSSRVLMELTEVDAMTISRTPLFSQDEHRSLLQPPHNHVCIGAIVEPSSFAEYMKICNLEMKQDSTKAIPMRAGPQSKPSSLPSLSRPTKPAGLPNVKLYQPMISLLTADRSSNGKILVDEATAALKHLNKKV